LTHEQRPEVVPDVAREPHIGAGVVTRCRQTEGNGFDRRGRGNFLSMSKTDVPDESEKVDPIDREAATIDARSEDAAERIAQLVGDAEALDRDVEDSPIHPQGNATEKRPDQSAGAGAADAG
jgi:hypothetical protein